MKVPLLDLQAQYRPLRAEILAAIERVCDSQRFIMGPEITALEDEMARLLGVRHAIAVSSGTDALLLALMALGVKPGDEVITPTYSFFATAGAVARLGARPVFVDIDEVSFNIDTAQAIAAITPRTKAIIPVHLFGRMAPLAERNGSPISVERLCAEVTPALPAEGVLVADTAIPPSGPARWINSCPPVGIVANDNLHARHREERRDGPALSGRSSQDPIDARLAG